MMGALVATMINFEISYKLPIGEKMIDFQDILNSIFPRLLPAIFTAFIFWLLGKKGMTSTKAIGIIIVLPWLFLPLVNLYLEWAHNLWLNH